jgi:glycine hydroxymethyltransferase
VDDRLNATLRASLHEQEEILRSSLVLNPVENFPFPDDLEVTAGPLHGLYNTDKVRTREQRLDTPMQFAGRTALERDSRLVYEAWADALGAADTTMRVLSGLHAHTVLFMAMARPGQTVLLLPVRAGGHLSGQAIIERLGLRVIEMPVDDEAMAVNIPAALEMCEREQPDYVFVDRSEGLVYEDFSAFAEVDGPTTIFDASQYLTNVIAGDHPNPFDWGYDLMVASVHKNFPGPQKALLATRERDERWQSLLKGVSTFVSNMHVASTYAAGLTLSRRDWLLDYSQRMLRVAVSLEDALHEREVPVVRRRRDLPPTHHVWIEEGGREAAFATYERLERCLIMTNFRTLPYSLGPGIRIGVNSAVRLGVTEDDVPRLADLIALIRAEGPTPALQEEALAFNQEIWSRAVPAHGGSSMPG